MKILHVISGLGDGGAEHTLYKLCKYDNKNEHVVVSLTKKGKYENMLRKIGIKVYSLDIGFFTFFYFFRIVNIFNLTKPNIVQTWLIYGDLLGGLVAKFLGYNNIIWNIRHSNLEIEINNLSNLFNLFLIKILSKLSYFVPKKIIIVSKNGKKNCENFGYKKNLFILIPNGYMLPNLKFKKYKRISFKKKLKIKKNIPVIGTLARFVPMKDHVNLLKSLSLIKLKNINFYCLLAGRNINKSNIKLFNLIKKFKLNNNVKLLGSLNDISNFMSTIDVYVQSSKYGEGFPNVIAEAMSHEIPSIATNVGDASNIIARTGWIVPPKNYLKLSASIEKALLQVGNKTWKKKSKQARLRIKSRYSIDKMIKSYQVLWSKVYNKS